MRSAFVAGRGLCTLAGLVFVVETCVLKKWYIDAISKDLQSPKSYG